MADARLYLDHQAPVLVGQQGARNFLSQTSVLSEQRVNEIERVPGVAETIPITQQYAMLRLHGRPVLALLIGYDPAKPGGPATLSPEDARGGEHDEPARASATFERGRPLLRRCATFTPPRTTRYRVPIDSPIARPARGTSHPLA